MTKWAYYPTRLWGMYPLYDGWFMIMVNSLSPRDACRSVCVLTYVYRSIVVSQLLHRNHLSFYVCVLLYSSVYVSIVLSRRRAVSPLNQMMSWHPFATQSLYWKQWDLWIFFNYISDVRNKCPCDFASCYWKWAKQYILYAFSSGLILGLCPANERWRYFITTSLIGWVQT